MSMGACYVAIQKDTLDELLASPQASLSDFVFDDANAPFITRYSLEQAWDAFRCLFEDDLPDLSGDELLQGVDLGECCFLIYPDQVARLAKGLAEFTLEELKTKFDSEEFQTADFYWETAWKEDFTEIAEMFNGLVAFFAGAAQRDEAMLFYIG